MHFIIIDLEWNNTYGRKTKSFINEVIEIGAVMLDGELREVSRFSCFIKSQIGKKLRGSVKELTNITNEDLRNGVPFTKALSDLRRWIGAGEHTVVTWGDGDIRVLIENYRYLNGIDVIPFLKNYADLQSYFQHVLKTSPARQVGLGAAAQMLEIDENDFFLHRAIGDSLLTAECMRKIYSEQEFSRFIRKCDKGFYEKLSFKPYVISSMDSPLVDRSKLCHVCETCGEPARQASDWRFVNRQFRATFYCPVCNDKIVVGVSFKKYYDRVEAKKTATVVTQETNDKRQETRKDGS